MSKHKTSVYAGPVTHINWSEALRNLLDQELLVDVTLACDGRSLRAHRAILSACSSYFQELFQESTHFHTIVILKDVKYQELEALVKFMYHGEVTVNHGMLPGFLHTAETLRVRGLTDGTFPGKFQSIDATKVPNCDQAGSDVDVLAADKEIELPSVQRLSLINSKRIKLEQPVASIFGHSVGIAPTEDSNSHNIDDENLSEQDALCPPKSEEHVHIASLDGLSQLVMPVIQDGSVHNSQYVGVCGNIPSQHHQLNQPLSHPLSHQSSNIGLGGNSASRPFRQRVLYNQEQLLQLEAWYRQDRYPSGALMREYADNLAAMVPNTSGNVGAQPMRQNVDYWFQNRRRKDFHPEVMQQREKKKLAKTLWGSYNGSGMPIAVGNSGDNNNHPENSVSSNR